MASSDKLPAVVHDRASQINFDNLNTRLSKFMTGIADGSITGPKIAPGAVTADKISVSQLSAITADMGSITAGTITGGTLQTATSGARVVLSAVGLRQYASDGTTIKVNIPNDGTDASIQGIITALGLNITSGELASPPTDRKVRWLRAVDGSLTSQVFGWYDSTGSSRNLNVEGTDVAGISFARVRLRGHPSNATVEVDASSLGASPSPLSASVTLLKADKSSAFLQLGTVGVSQCGKTTLHWPAGSADSNALNLPVFCSSVVGSIAGLAQWAGSGVLVTVDAISGGNFVQLVGHRSPTPASALDLDVSYINWGAP